VSIEDKAKLVRKWCLISTTEAGSGHPTSSLSAADLMTVLFDKFYTFDLKNPHNLANDRLIFSKGHASPLFYTMYAAAGGISFDDLKTLRKFGSNLEGHPMPEFPFTEAATGSLGQGLSVGAGMSLGLTRDKSLVEKPHVYVLLGDSELAEGQNWEAANFASYHKLSNLIAIADINRLGQSQETMFGHHTEEYEKRFKAFGWETVVIDGHNFEEIEKAFNSAVQNNTAKPFIIIAKTFKGKGISFLEDKEGWHGKTLSKDELAKALQELGDVKDEVVFDLRKPSTVIARTPAFGETRNDIGISFNKGEEVSTREIYGKVLAELANTHPEIYALDAEVKNSTFSIDFLKAHPEKFVECFIAEQNMVSAAAGLSRLGYKPFVSTFAAFLSRAFDQIRMARLSEANISFVGSHAGVAIGEDGPSQMGLEDIAMFAALPGTVIFHPSDAVSAAKLLAVMLNLKGISYMRTLRQKTPILYDSNEEFHVGGSKILKKSDKDFLTIVAAGTTLHEVLKAYDILVKEDIYIRIIDSYCIKPIDRVTILNATSETKIPKIITVEDHFSHGGLGDISLSALAAEPVTAEKMAVRKIARSGTKDELLDFEGINAKAIVAKVRTFT